VTAERCSAGQNVAIAHDSVVTKMGVIHEVVSRTHHRGHPLFCCPADGDPFPEGVAVTNFKTGDRGRVKTQILRQATKHSVWVNVIVFPR